MRTNTWCTVCTECVKSCRKSNVAINARPWGSDLATLAKPRRDEAILALVMVSLTSFHGLTMTPAWSEILAWLRAAAGLGHLAAFSLGMSVVLALPAALYLLSSRLASRWLGPAGGRASTAAVATRYAYPLIAVALTYHLAHNAGHFLLEAGSFVPVVSDPLGSGLNLFGTRDFAPSPLASQGVIWTLQIALVLIGLYWALRTTERAHRDFAGVADGEVALRGRLVPAAFLLLVTVFDLWLLAQPMEMRTGM